jgi:hypothetical protein
MKEYLSFVDESGDPDFSEGATKSFFVCATIINKEDKERIANDIKVLLKKHGLHELKSSHIKSENRRKEILKELGGWDIQVYTVYVNKESLKGDWFRFRGSFYKYVQRLLVSEIFRVFGDSDITFDSFGKPEYRDSFKKYISKSVQIELFKNEIVIGSPKDDLIIQLSDFISGSLRKLYEGDNNDADKFLQKIWKGKRKVESRNDAISTIEVSYLTNSELSSVACDIVEKYISDHENIDEKEPHVEVLQYLLQMVIEDPDRYCYRSEIVEWLRYLEININEESLSRTIISDLRDDNVILISSNDGIKIPLNFEEILEHYKFMLGQAIPSIRRLKKLDQILSARFTEQHSIIMSKFDEDVKNILNEVHSK